MIADTPNAPYYAVIFTSKLNANHDGYIEMAEEMENEVKNQPGFLGMESARNEIGITISYWESLESIAQWKANTQHQKAQAMGRGLWYSAFTVRVCKVEREYSL